MFMSANINKNAYAIRMETVKAQARSNLMRGIQDAFAKGKFSDFTIICGPDEHKVHKLVICPPSKFFANLVKFGKEASEGRAHLVDDKPALVRLMIQFFYQLDYSLPSIPSHSAKILDWLTEDPDVPGPLIDCLVTASPNAHILSQAPSHRQQQILDDYMLTPFGPLDLPQYLAHRRNRHMPVEPQPRLCAHGFRQGEWHCPKDGESNSSSPADVVMHTYLYTLADKYDIPDLKALATEKFRATVHFHWNTKFFAIAAYVVMTTTPDSDRGLRDIVVQMLAAKSELVESELWESVLEACPGLAVELVKVVGKEVREARRGVIPTDPANAWLAYHF